MKDIHESIRFARHYLREHSAEEDEDLKLNRSLQYLLCLAYNRIDREFGEVTKRDIVLICESWIVAQGTAHPKEGPLVD